MAFRSIGSLEHTNQAPLLRRYVIANSITVTVNDSVKLATGFVALGTAGALVLGHVNSISAPTGLGVNTSGQVGAGFGSYVNSFLTASNNQTVAQIKADVDINKFSLYAATANAAFGTTTGSNLAGYHIDLQDQSQLDEDSVVTATAQYSTHGMDTTVATQAVINIYESQLL